MLKWSLLVGLLVLAGCDDTIEYHRVAFPGFALEVPTALSYTGNRDREYTAGSTNAISERNQRAVFVTWQPGTLSTPEEMVQYVNATAALMPTRGATVTTNAAVPTTVGGRPALRIEAKIDTFRVALVEIECGTRSIQLAAIARRGLDAIVDKMLASFACTPDAVAEARVGGVPIGVDDPTLLAGYHHVEDPDMYTVTNDTVSLMFTAAPGGDRDDADALHKMIPVMFGAHGTWTNDRREKRTIGGEERVFQHGHLTADGTTMYAVVVMWNCGSDRTDAVMGLAMALEAADVATSVDVLAKLRCSKPGDAPLQLRAAPAADEPVDDAPDPDAPVAPVPNKKHGPKK